jgi:hypothetical protein
MLVGRLEILGQVDRRGAIRFDVATESTLRGVDGRPLDVMVEDFSATGFRFAAKVALPVDTLISLGLSGAGARLASIVWRDGEQHGCMFLEPLTPGEMTRAFQSGEARVADIAAALSARSAAAASEEPAPSELEPESPERPRWRRAIDALRTRFYRR